MRTMQSYLSQKQQEFSHHSFLQTLKEQRSIEAVARFAPQLMFWAMVFQDVLRLNEQKITDRKLRRIASHHRIEDANHDKWLLQDIEHLHNGKLFDIPWLFSKEQAKSREIAYALMSETFHANEDIFRIILLLTLESTGHVFFEHVAAYAQRVEHNLPLKYLSRFHLDVEKSHELFEEELESVLYEISLSSEQQQQAKAMIDRAYASFTQLFDLLEAAIMQKELEIV